MILKKYSNLIFWSCSALFILLNIYFIIKEIPLIPFISAGAVLVYFLIFRADLLLYILALVTPFSIVMRDDAIQLGLSIPSEVIMISLTFLFLCRILYDLTLDRRILKHPISIAIFIYLTWMFITCVTSELPIVSFKFWASKIWFIVSSYFMVIQLIKNNLKNAVTFFSCYAFGLACVVIITTIRHALTGFAQHGSHWIMAPFYNDHTAYGAILAFFLPIVIGFMFLPKLSKSQKTLYLFMAVVFLVGFYLSFSRAAWISILGAIGVWVVLKLRIKFSWLIVGITAVGFTLYHFQDDILYQMQKNTQDSSGKLSEHIRSISNITTDASNVERLNRWNSAFGMIKERPLVGWGPGTYQFVYAPFQKPKDKTIITTNFGDGGNAHSEYIGPCAESGFIGLATVLALMVIILYYGITTYIRAKDKSVKILSLAALLALISYYIHGVLNNFLDTDKLSLPFWAAFALIAVLNSYYLNGKQEDENFVTLKDDATQENKQDS